MNQENFQLRIGHLETWVLVKLKETTSETAPGGSQKAKWRQRTPAQLLHEFWGKVTSMTAKRGENLGMASEGSIRT